MPVALGNSLREAIRSARSGGRTVLYRKGKPAFAIVPAEDAEYMQLVDTGAMRLWNAEQTAAHLENRAGDDTLISFGTTTFTDEADFSYENLGGGNTGTFALGTSNLTFTVVPEPGTIGLAMVGLTLAALRRRMRR